MAEYKKNLSQNEHVIIEEDNGIFQQKIEQISSKKNEKRKRNDEEEKSINESPNKYKQIDDRTRISTTNINENSSLIVPFWKNINQRQSSIEFHTNEIACFSLLTQDNKKECFNDKRYLRIYKYPFKNLDVNFDLKIGEINTVVEEHDKNINAMLWWLLENKEKIYKNNQFIFDFLSWRGVLRLIMFSIYEKHSDWLLAVIKFKNAYFLCEYITEKQINDEQNMTEEHRTFCSYGHKFEEYVTRNYESKEILNSSKQFTGVFHSTIGHHRLLYGAEMDCILDKSQSTMEHIELKLCAGKSLNDLPFQYNRKFAKWWIQCFLVGIQRMVIGLRDNNGIVHKISPLDISDIERATRTWSRQSFFNFFLIFADFLKENVTKEYSIKEKEVTLFYFSPSSQRITVEKSTDSKYQFLSDQFLNEFQ